jgi:hypothetical protein
LWGDLGVCEFEFEIWRSICRFDYEFLSAGAIDKGEYLIISLEKLLFLKALAMKVEKYRQDLELIVKKLLDDQYAAWLLPCRPGDCFERSALAMTPGVKRHCE